MGRSKKKIPISNKLIAVLALLIVTNLNVLAFGKTENWFEKISKIKLGITKREEVERLFNSPKVKKVNKFKASETVSYATKEGVLYASYSLGKCSEGFDEYDLEKGTIVDLFFSSSKPIEVSKLKLDLTQFKSQNESDTENWIYTNDDLGLWYGVNSKKQLIAADISLTDKQEQQYSCKSKSQSSRINFYSLENIMYWSIINSG